MQFLHFIYKALIEVPGSGAEINGFEKRFWRICKDNLLWVFKGSLLTLFVITRFTIIDISSHATSTPFYLCSAVNFYATYIHITPPPYTYFILSLVNSFYEKSKKLFNTKYSFPR